MKEVLLNQTLGMKDSFFSNIHFNCRFFDSTLKNCHFFYLPFYCINFGVINERLAEFVILCEHA